MDPMVETTSTPAVVGSAPPRSAMDAFGLMEWGLLASIALMWGSSFLLIDAALASFSPPLITLLRLVFGAGTLVWFRKAHASIERSDRMAVFLLGVFWMAGPF